MLLFLRQCFSVWTDVKLSNSCMRRGTLDVWNTGRKDRKGLMSHEAEECKRDIF